MKTIINTLIVLILGLCLIAFGYVAHLRIEQEINHAINSHR